MAPPLAILLFLASAALTFVAAGVFAERLDHVGPRLGLPEAVVGLVTAVAADAPEISSALVALTRGEKQVSLGVVLGSNAFNLAAMVGLSAVLAGSVRLGREALLLEGAVGLLATAIAAALVLGALPAWAALLLFAAILAPYLLLVTRRGHNPLDERTPGTRRHVDEGALWRS